MLTRLDNFRQDRQVQLYARYQVRQFWVVDANERTAWVHTGPTGGGWSSFDTREPQQEMVAQALTPERDRLTLSRRCRGKDRSTTH